MIFIYCNCFPPGGSGRLPGRKVVKRQLYTKGETIHKKITTKLQKRRIHKTEKKVRNEKTKYKYKGY